MFGWVEGEVGCDLLEVLAAVLSTRGQLVLTTPLAALGESAAAAAIIREARLADAVVAITDVSQRLPKNDAIRAAQTIDVLAAAIPLVAIGPEPLNPAVEPNTGRVILHAVTSAAEQREEALAVAAREWLSRDEIAAIAADQTLSTQQATALSGALSVLPTSHPRAAVERVLRDQGSGGADPLAALLARVETLWQSGDQFLRLGIVGPSSAAVAEAIARHLGLSFVWGVSKGNARPALTGQPARLLHFNEGDPTPALTPPGLYMLVSPRAHPRLANAVDQIIELGAAKGGLLDVLADAHGVGFE